MQYICNGASLSLRSLELIYSRNKESYGLLNSHDNGGIVAKITHHTDPSVALKDPVTKYQELSTLDCQYQPSY